MVRTHRIAMLSAAGLAATLTLAGCGAWDKLTGGGEEKATLVAAQNPQLGAIVTDSKGRTLYLWDMDTTRPPKSNCERDCSSTWIPVTADDQTTVQGVEASLVGSIKREEDGSTQLTLAGAPLYRFFKDKKPGDVKGQGIAGTWWVAAPDGSKIKTTRPDAGAGGQ